MQSFMQDKENFSFWLKNALLGYFNPEFEKTIVILEARTLEFFKCKVSYKIKGFRFNTKNALFWYFWAEILKNYCHI